MPHERETFRTVVLNKVTRRPVCTWREACLNSRDYYSFNACKKHTVTDRSQEIWKASQRKKGFRGPQLAASQREKSLCINYFRSGATICNRARPGFWRMPLARTDVVPVSRFDGLLGGLLPVPEPEKIAKCAQKRAGNVLFDVIVVFMRLRTLEQRYLFTSRYRYCDDDRADQLSESLSHGKENAEKAGEVVDGRVKDKTCARVDKFHVASRPCMISSGHDGGRLLGCLVYRYVLSVSDHCPAAETARPDHGVAASSSTIWTLDHVQYCTAMTCTVIVSYQFNLLAFH